MAIARDKFWMFGVRPHQDDIWLKPPSGEKASYRYRSRITPAEGALILDTPNMLMINCEGEPVPYSEDAYGYAESFSIRLFAKDCNVTAKADNAATNVAFFQIVDQSRDCRAFSDTAKVDLHFVARL